MNDAAYLSQAVELAAQSPDAIGCGVVIANREGVIARAFNSQDTDRIAINHAEIKAIVLANLATGSRRLEATTAYCSCEPCVMCLAALSYAKVERIIFCKRMKDLFPNDPQAHFDSFAFVKGLNFVPKLEQLEL